MHQRAVRMPINCQQGLLNSKYSHPIHAVCTLLALPAWRQVAQWLMLAITTLVYSTRSKVNNQEQQGLGYPPWVSRSPCLPSPLLHNLCQLARAELR